MPSFNEMGSPTIPPAREDVLEEVFPTSLPPRPPPSLSQLWIARVFSSIFRHRGSTGADTSNNDIELGSGMPASSGVTTPQSATASSGQVSSVPITNQQHRTGRNQLAEEVPSINVETRRKKRRYLLQRLARNVPDTTRKEWLTCISLLIWVGVVALMLLLVLWLKGSGRIAAPFVN
ncbi:uncharacterized protein BDR25DRAFT_315059 [Lindgomyces ingoldianus]|uniref:Uncharacterized protein n=1 Tax=Lindgomyces ingoldianus TaxID=673940 RepID=A0ACB6QUF9_9PLEO|nr:uncharacterized protein BDR25DRAFT_315059 [Lindgomyces ingoldianus]KAF2469821.1 hypothetical protein BDR25DRAFT_315059 [Lindgomyces ingoldianus]